MKKVIILEKLPFYTPDKNLPGAYIFDIDGTLAQMNGRTPYEWDRVGEDTCNYPVAEVLKSLSISSNKIIIFTGRDGVCRKKTLDWLEDHFIYYHHFDMRAEGDNRKDVIVKREMFDRVKGKYNILGVFDDRDQVVAMWREVGLQCFQVNYGDF